MLLGPRLLLAAAIAAVPATPALSRAPAVQVHYLGHAAFVLTFDNGLTVLTDYGQSRAWGLDSPIHGLGALVPDVATHSHDHLDHAGGALPEGIGLLLEDGAAGEVRGVAITPIPTFERSIEAADNTSYLFTYRGLKILHLADCQALMKGVGDERVRDRIRALYPDRYDLVLLPIGFVDDVLEQAAQTVALLDARIVVPMHYWSPGDRDAFLRLMATRADAQGRPYRVEPPASAELVLTASTVSAASVRLVGLTPAPAPELRPPAPE